MIYAVLSTKSTNPATVAGGHAIPGVLEAIKDTTFLNDKLEKQSL